MSQKVIAVFDIGKTNKKILLFDKELKIVYEKEEIYPETKDEDGVECDDIELLQPWILDTVKDIVSNPEFDVKAINFATYGATLMYVDKAGRNLTPIYNYLKPMPENVVEPLYEKYGGVDEFSRKTASPAMGMLNSGLQALWLKKIKPEVFESTETILHFPQYLSSLFTGEMVSELTSIGCHTALWDFDNNCYHQWVVDEGINFPEPVSNYTSFNCGIEGKEVEVGIGIHDSSSSLAPYIENSQEPFVLLSTGTWCINMNPFNEEPLTAEQLEKDSLCNMGVHQKPVKSSRLFMGHIQDVNTEIIAKHFNADSKFFQKMVCDETAIKAVLAKEKVFFKNGVPEDYVDAAVDLTLFATVEDAYRQFLVDLTRVLVDQIKLVIAKEDITKAIYVSGGFAKSEMFVRLLATFFPNKKVYTSEVNNATALGAALMLYDKLESTKPNIDLGLKLFDQF